MLDWLHVGKERERERSKVTFGDRFGTRIMRKPMGRANNNELSQLEMKKVVVLIDNRSSIFCLAP
jgi:hypothetical protein